jgi:hypothetical protein
VGVEVKGDDELDEVKQDVSPEAVLDEIEEASLQAGRS